MPVPATWIRAMGETESVEGIMMKQLIYHSEPFGYDRATLAGILMDARHHNRRDGITGALICRHDFYLQLIEGPPTAVDAAYARIAADDRHCEVRLLLSQVVDERMFPAWDMFHDEMPPLTWSPAAIAGGAIEAAGLAELQRVFARVRTYAAGVAGA